MNFYKGSHKYYCGVDLHSRTMYICIVGRDGAVLLHRSLPSTAPRPRATASTPGRPPSSFGEDSCPSPTPIPPT